MNIVIKTDRTRIRPVEISDAPNILRYYNKNVTEYLVYGPNRNFEAAEEFIKKSQANFENQKSLTFSVEDSQGKFLGLISLNNVDSKTPEIGLWLRESAQGKGFGREIVFGLTGWVMDNIDFDHIVYRAAKENDRSWKIAEELIKEFGGEYSGEAKDTLRGKEYVVKCYNVSRM